MLDDAKQTERASQSEALSSSIGRIESQRFNEVVTPSELQRVAAGKQHGSSSTRREGSDANWRRQARSDIYFWAFSHSRFLGSLRSRLNVRSNVLP